MSNKNNKLNIQQNMIFNTIGSLVYYTCQWAMTVIIVKISGYSDAGILAVAMSVTASPAIVGLFNIRNFQVSDIKGEFSNKTYIQSRIFTNILSLIICAIMVIWGGYTIEKALPILCFMLLKVAEGFADVLYGIEQINFRMDYVGISMMIRGVGTLSFFVLGFFATHSLLMSIVFITVFNYIVIIFFDRKIIKRWIAKEDRFSTKEMVKLLGICFPLALVAFLNNLSLNIPKIFLESYYGSNIMGYYASVSSPTVVIQLIATTIFAPIVPILTIKYNNQDKKAFLSIMIRFFSLTIILSLISLLIAKILGKWGLILIFGNEIANYVSLFVPIVIISILIAFNACLFSVCTLLRIIKQQYVIGIVGLMISWILSLILVKHFSMMGVVYTLGISLLAQILIQLFLIINIIRKMNY